MEPRPGRPPVQVIVPNLVGLHVAVARDFAHRSQLVAVGPDPDLPATLTGSVVRQEPLPGSIVPRWSTVLIWTSDRGPGDAGVREPRRPSPPPLSVQLHQDEPEPVPTEPEPVPRQDEDDPVVP